MPKKATETVPIQDKKGQKKLIAKDLLGRNIEIGSYLAWCVRRGSSIWQSLGRVRKIKWEKDIQTQEDIITIYVWVASPLEMAEGISYIPRKTAINTTDRCIILPAQDVENSEHPGAQVLKDVICDGT